MPTRQVPTSVSATLEVTRGSSAPCSLARRVRWAWEPHTLAQARQKAQDARRLLADQDDPLAQKDAAKAKRRLEATVKRTGEVIGARLGGSHLEEKVWSVPAGRMKRGTEAALAHVGARHLFQKLETAKRHSVTAITSCVVSVR
jgi:hypothetical protein